MMVKPTWFSEEQYIADKLVMVNAQGYLGQTTTTVTAALAEVGGAWNHYNLFGYKESAVQNNVAKYLDLKDSTGKVVFNTQLYLESKLATMDGLGADSWTELAEQFAALNMSPYAHYLAYGAQEGLTINAGFNTANYFAAKLQSLVKADPATYSSWNVAELSKYFAENSLDPYSNFLTYGAAEGITPAMVAAGGSLGGQTYYLTEGQDNLTGTAGNDTFVAYSTDAGRTLNSGDRIDGGSGRDVLEGDLTTGNVVLTAITNNVEVVKFNARDEGTGTGANYTKALVDAERMHGVEEFWSTKSRANVSIEDVITDSNKMTSVFQSSDPGAVDFSVFFNSQHLKSDATATTGKLNLQLIDGFGAAATPATPLLNNVYDTVKFHFNGKQYVVKFAVVDGADATYAKLATAIQTAIDANAELKAGGVTATVGPDFTFTNRDGTSVTGQNVVLSSNAGALEAITGQDGWNTSGVVPPNSNLSTGMTNGSTDNCPLIMTKIGLDNVGSIKWDDASAECLPDDAIFGSRSGNMVVGGMGARDGVQSFLITADRGSWLNSLSSTNNQLRSITLKSGDLNGDGVAGISATKGGQVFIGDHDAATTTAGGNIAWQDSARLLGFGIAAGTGITAAPAGIWDVKEFLAGDYTGNINIAAQFTAASFAKYLSDIDGLKTVYDSAPLGGAKGEFLYQFGTGDDTLNMKVNGGIVADRDFVLNMEMGAGNDFVNFAFDFVATNWALDQTGSFAATAGNGTYSGGRNNVTIDAGAGDDVVRTWVGATAVAAGTTDQANAAFKGNYGAINMKLGDGDDLVYAAQSSGAKTNAVWVLNANSNSTDDRTISFGSTGAQPHNNAVASTLTKWTDTATVDATKEYNVKVLVDFMGVKAEVVLAGKYKTTASTGNSTLEVTASDMNDAIIKAINNDPILSNLLIAKDGAGNSLLVESLIDGKFDGDLAISFFNKATTDTAYSTAMTFTAQGSAGYLQQAYDANATAGAADGEDEHYYGFTNIEGGAGNDILVTGYADAYVKSGAGKDTIIVGNKTYNKITAGADADNIVLGKITSAAGGGNNVASQAGSFDIVHQAKGDSGVFTSATAVTATNPSIQTATFDVIHHFDKVATNILSDHLVLDDYAASATPAAFATGGSTGTDVATFAALKTYIAATNNGYAFVQGTYNSITGTFLEAAAGADMFLVYDADSSAAKQYEGVVLVGQGAATTVAGADAGATAAGYLTITV